MAEHAPRDLGEWMRSIERKVQSAQRAASSIPLSYNEQVRDDILADTVRHPAAPVEIVHQTALYTEAGLARKYARVTVDFPDVTKATDGTDIPILQYELWGRDDSTNLLEASTSAVPGIAAPGLTIPGMAATAEMKTVASAAVGDWALLSTSRVSSLRHAGMTPGAVWSFRVRAIGEFTTAPGEWSQEFQTQMGTDTTPPPQPTVPQLTVSMGTITVRWDGLSAAGAMPGDFDHLVVAGGPSASPTVQVDVFYRGGGLTVISGLPYYTPYHVRFQAVDQAGNRSNWSEQATAFTTPLVDTDVILAEIDATKTVIKNIGAESILSGAILADKLAENAVTQSKLADQIISAGKLDINVSGQIQKGIDDALAANNAAVAADAKAGTAQGAADQAAADALAASNLAATKGKTLIQSNAPGAEDRNTFTLWIDTTGGANTPKRWTSGTTWVEVTDKVAKDAAALAVTAKNTADTAFADAQVALTNAGLAQAAANARNRTYYTATAPSGSSHLLNDMWFRQSDNKVHLWDGDSWEPRVDTAIAAAQSAATAAGTAAATADGKAVAAKTAADQALADALAAKNIGDAAAAAGAAADAKAVAAQTKANKAETDAATAKGIGDEAAAAAATADGKAVAAQTKANTAFTDAAAALTAGNNAATLANAIVKTSTSAATGTPPSAGALWHQTNAGGDLIIKTWTSNAAGTAWVERKLDDAVIGNLNAATINAGIINAARFNAADIRAKFLTAGLITAADIVTGTLTSASGVFGTVDASILNAGTINAARLVAADIRAKFLTAGKITAADLVTGTLTSASGVFGTVDASVINAGTLNAARFNAADVRAKFIEAGKITAADLVTGTLTSASGVFGTMDASIINAGTLNAARLNAGDIRAKFLEAGKISAVDMITGTITAASGIIGSLDGGVITAGSIKGAAVEAGTLTANHVVVTDTTNIYPDPYFKLGIGRLFNTTGWVYGSSNNGGKGAIQYINAVPGSTVTAPSLPTAIPVSEGSIYHFSADIAVIDGSTPDAELRVLFYDKDGSAWNIGVPLNNNANKAVGFAGLGNSYITLRGTLAVPAGRVAMQFRPTFYTTTGTGEQFFISNMRILRANNADLIVDGAITADKVAANAVQAKHLLVGDFANIALGSDFEDATAIPWTLHASHTRSTVTAKTGAASLRLAASATVDKSTFLGDLRVKPGEQYYFKLHAWIDTAFNGTTNSKLRIADQNGTQLDSISFSGITRNAWTTVPLEVTTTVPAGVTSLQVELWSSHTAGTAYVDDIQIRRVSEPSLIQNLGVEKLTASAANMGQAVIDKLWADVVRSKKITTDMLVVSGENLVPDPYFLDPAQNLVRTSSNGPHLLGPDDVSTGNLLRFTGHGAATTLLYLHSDDTRIQVIPGGEYGIALNYRTRGVTVPDKTTTLEPVVWQYGPAGAYLRQSILPATTRTSASGAVWLSIEEKFVAPTDAGFIRLFLRVKNEAASSDLEIKLPRIYRKASAALIVDGAIAATHLSTDSVTAGAIKALAIETGHLKANAVETDKIKAGAISAEKLESTLVLSSRIVAGPVNGTHAEMDPNGFKVFSDDPVDGVPNEVIRMGVAASGDYFLISKANGQPAASMSDDGKVSGMEVHATNSLTYQGRELSAILADLPQGVVGYGDAYTGITNIGNEYGIFDVKVTLMPGRAYDFSMLSMTSSSIDSGNGIHRIRIMHGGVAAPTLTSDIVKTVEYPYSSTLQHTNAVTWLWYPQVAVPTPVRLLYTVQKFGGGVITWHGGELIVKDVGVSRLTVGTINNGGGTTAPPVEVRQARWECSNSRNYKGDLSTDTFDPSHMYQGQSPAGSGNMKSIAVFAGNPLLANRTIAQELAGATVNWIRVYFNFQHWYYNSGGLAQIGVHNHSTVPSTFSGTGAPLVGSGGWPKPGARWIDLPSSTFAGFKGGTLKGVYLEGIAGNYGTYGFADRPTIEINYTK